MDVFFLHICRKIARNLNESTWIGLNDINTEAEWYWIDGVRFSLDSSLWQPGEPNNYSNNENCAYLHVDSKVLDWSCNGRLYGLCDIE